MPFSIVSRVTWLAGPALGAVLLLCAGQAARAAAITASYLAAGVQTPDFSTICGTATTCSYGTEAFTSWNGGAFTSTFSTGANNFTSSTYIRGNYTANGDTAWTKSAANQYGGANGTDPYPGLSGATNGSAYMISLTRSANIPGVNYFGIWISALDAPNSIQFYNQGQLIFTFGATDLVSALGSCSGTTNAYCGNPTTPFKGQNSGELYAYVNFFAQTGYFDRVVLVQAGGSGGFESSSHAVGYVNPLTVSGSTFNAQDRPLTGAYATKAAALVAISEPSTLLVIGSALATSLLLRRRPASRLARRRTTARVLRLRGLPGGRATRQLPA